MKCVHACLSARKDLESSCHHRRLFQVLQVRLISTSVQEVLVACTSWFKSLVNSNHGKERGVHQGRSS